MSVSLAANTEEAFQEHLVAERQENPQLSPQNEAGYRWSVGEWRHEGWRHDLFAAVNRLLYDEATQERIANIHAHLARLFETMTVALAGLRRERGALTEGTILFVTLTDSDEAEDVENHSAQHVSPPALLKLFSERYS